MQIGDGPVELFAGMGVRVVGVAAGAPLVAVGASDVAPENRIMVNCQIC